MEKFNELIQSSTPILVDFYADWCGPCKSMKPVLEDLKEQIGDKARIIKINVDNYKRLAAEYKIKTIPTFILFKEGQSLWRHSGMITANNLEKVIDQHL